MVWWYSVPMVQSRLNLVLIAIFFLLKMNATATVEITVRTHAKCNILRVRVCIYIYQYKWTCCMNWHTLESQLTLPQNPKTKYMTTRNVTAKLCNEQKKSFHLLAYTVSNNAIHIYPTYSHLIIYRIFTDTLLYTCDFARAMCQNINLRTYISSWNFYTKKYEIHVWTFGNFIRCLYSVGLLMLFLCLV